jgi:mRNA-degrading endonuclease RelE of RelBE toxin-antitoxin system
MTIIQSENKDQIEAFDGELLHPSLDIKNQILSIGFRYRISAQEEAEIFVVVHDNQANIVNTESFKIKDKLYFFEKRGRKLMRIEDRWNLNELKKFISSLAEFKAEIPKPNKLFSELLDLAKRHIELELDIDYDLLVAWVLGTYFYPIFSAYPFLHIKAPKRSGKSQCLNFLGQLCFNAVKSRPSLPALGDTVDSLRGTYLIDQADSLERKGGEELLDVLADSYKKSGGKRRIINFDKRKGREVLEFETYSPKVFASIRELPEDLRDRCLAIGLIRSQKNFPDPDDSGIDWRGVRGGIYKYLISNYSVIEGTYTVRKIGYREKQEKIGRSLELWLPFEIILECFNQEDKIQEGWKRFSAQYGFSEYEPNELEEATIKAIMGQLEGSTEAILNPMEISELIDNNAFTAGDTSKQKAAKVGWAIKKFNLASEKRPRTKDGVRYLFEKKKVEGIFQSYFKNLTEHTPLAQESFGAVNTEEIDM